MLTDERKGELKKIALEIYSNPERDNIFAMVKEQYPDWNDVNSDDSSEAAYAIRDELVADVRKYDDLGDDEKDFILEELGEMIYAGLT